MAPDVDEKRGERERRKGLSAKEVAQVSREEGYSEPEREELSKPVPKPGDSEHRKVVETDETNRLTT